MNEKKEIDVLELILGTLILPNQLILLNKLTK